jgi:UDP-glucose 4-epimerase
LRRVSNLAKAIPSRTLVIGCGFIGERFASELVKRGTDTVVLTRSEPNAVKRSGLEGAEIVVGDAASTTLSSALSGVGNVIYAAGGLMPAESEQEPATDAALTLRPLASVLDALAARPGVTLTYISSGGTIYGQPRYLPVDEEHPTEPISAYGINKLAAEKLVVARAERYGTEARILRCSNVYGETQPAHRGQGAIVTFAAHLSRGDPIVLYGDGGVIRDYVHVDDVVSAGLALCDQPPDPRVVNIGLGAGHSLAQVIDLIDKISNNRLTVQRRPRREFDIHEIVLDVSRLKMLIPFYPIPLEDGIRRVLGRATSDDARIPVRARREQ